MEYHKEHRSWSTWREQRLSAVFEICSFLSKHPARKNAPFLIFAFFVCFLPQNQFQYTSWHAEDTNRVIFSSHHVEMSHLNCKTVGQRDFSRFLGLCLWLGANLKNPPSRTPQNRVFFVPFFASSNVSFGLIREALHRFNGCAKIWSAPGIYCLTLYLSLSKFEYNIFKVTYNLFYILLLSDITNLWDRELKYY